MNFDEFDRFFLVGSNMVSIELVEPIVDFDEIGAFIGTSDEKLLTSYVISNVISNVFPRRAPGGSEKASSVFARDENACKKMCSLGL